MDTTPNQKRKYNNPVCLGVSAGQYHNGKCRKACRTLSGRIRTKGNVRNLRGLHSDDDYVYSNHRMLDRTISWSWYPGLWCAAIDGGGAVRRGFDGGRNDSCCVEILHLEGLVVII